MHSERDRTTARGFAQILLDQLFAFSSEKFQRSVWIRGDHPKRYVQDYVEAMEVLRDIEPLLNDEHYYPLIPFSEEEIAAFREFNDLIERFDDRLTVRDAAHALADPHWPEITAAAARTLRILEGGRHGLHHEATDP